MARPRRNSVAEVETLLQLASEQLDSAIRDTERVAQDLVDALQGDIARQFPRAPPRVRAIRLPTADAIQLIMARSLPAIDVFVDLDEGQRILRIEREGHVDESVERFCDLHGLLPSEGEMLLVSTRDLIIAAAGKAAAGGNPKPLGDDHEEAEAEAARPRGKGCEGDASGVG